MEDEADTSHITTASNGDERVRFALAAARMGVFEWNPNSDLLTWSSATTGLGLDVEEAPTSGSAFLALLHPDDRAAIVEIRERALRDRTDAVAEFRILSPSGVVHWVQAHDRVVYDTDGKPLRVLGVNADITYRKSLEEQLRTAQIQAERLRTLKATMRTVQDIVTNALTSLQLFRLDAERHVSRTSLDQFDRIIAETAAKLKALGDLEHVVETDMALGTGIDFQSQLPREKP
jgi:PAS domain S-box-containing protein